MRFDEGQDGAAVVFEVDEEDEGLRGVYGEDAVFITRLVRRGGDKVLDGVLMLQDSHYWVDIHGCEGALFGERVSAVADVEFVVEEPDVCFDACAAPFERFVERDAAPVVVV